MNRTLSIPFLALGLGLLAGCQGGSAPAPAPALPLMPWQDYTHLTDEELKAVFAYLRSIPAMTNHVPDPVILPMPGAPPATGGGAPAKPSGT